MVNKIFIRYTLSIVLTCLIFFSCEDNFEYEKLTYDMKEKSIELGNDSAFIIDSIVLRHQLKSLYVSFLKNNNDGYRYLKLFEDNKKYKIFIDNLGDECDSIYRTGWTSVEIWARHKLYDGANSVKNRDSVQVFGYKYFPCGNDVITLEARGRI